MFYVLKRNIIIHVRLIRTLRIKEERRNEWNQEEKSFQKKSH
nr:MAG TPA: hypothetical protein [Caudoviricetes sp.]